MKCSVIPILILVVLFLVNPFFAFLCSFAVLYKTELDYKGVTACLIIIAAFWGILAFTQKSHASIDTDCIRYYYGFSEYESMNVYEAIKSLELYEIVHFTFVFSSTAVVSLTGNVQFLSFFWVFITYIFTYQSVKLLMKIHGCYTQRSFATIILLLSFGFILFVQVSELLKQASAFAIFFYAFTKYMDKHNIIYTIVLLVASIGIHPSVAMALPVFFYNMISTKKLLIIAILAIPLFIFVDFIGLFYSILPAGHYFELLMEKYSPDSSGPSGTPQYIAILMLMLFMALEIWRRTDEKKCLTANIVILYFIVSFSNFGNLVAFLRFALFSHWLFALMMVRYLSINNFKFPQIAKIIIIGMFLLSARFSSGRLFGNFYSSSYMDNSIFRLVTSTSIDYLNEKYNK